MKKTKTRTRVGVAIALLGSISLISGLIAPVAGADPNENANERAFEATGSEGGQPDGEEVEGEEVEGEEVEGEEVEGEEVEGEEVQGGGSDGEVSSAGAGPSEDGARGQTRAQQVRATDHSNNGANGTGDQGNRPEEPKEPKEPNENSAKNPDRDPPGNNGTIKIDGLEWDEHPDNEPHPGCLFEVDFYNYGPSRSASLSFTAQAPTGSGEQIAGRSLILEADGAGGGTDHDGAIRVNLTSALSKYEPHPKQGYHVKLTVTVDDEDRQGAQVKHKVFWVGPCEDVGGGDVQRAALNLDKVTAGSGIPAAGTTYRFSVACDGRDAIVRNITAEGAAVELFDDLLPGTTCTITETRPGGAVVTYGISPSAAGNAGAGNVATITIPEDAAGDGVDVTVTFTNTFSESVVGALRLAKVTTGNDVPSNRDFVFNVTCGSTLRTVTITAGDAAEDVFENLEPGTECTLVETEDRDADATSTVVNPGGATRQGTTVVVTVPSDGAVVTVTYTNTFNTGGTVGGVVTSPPPDEVAGVVITNPVQSPGAVTTKPVQSPGAVITNPGPNVVVERPAPRAITPDVLGEQLTRVETVAQPTTEVLGVQVTRGGQLARTGSDLTNLLTLAGMVMLFSGLLLVTQSRTQSRKAFRPTI